MKCFVYNVYIKSSITWTHFGWVRPWQLDYIVIRLAYWMLQPWRHQSRDCLFEGKWSQLKALAFMRHLDSLEKRFLKSSLIRSVAFHFRNWPACPGCSLDSSLSLLLPPPSFGQHCQVLIQSQIYRSDLSLIRSWSSECKLLFNILTFIFRIRKP